MLETTGEAPRAEALRSRLAALGHGVVACDAALVVTASAAADVHRFVFETDAFVCEPRGAASRRLPYGELLALVRARCRADLETTRETTHKRLDLGAAALSGGLILTRKETRSVTSSARQERQALYVFQRSAQHTQVLFDDRLDYTGLAERRGRTTVESFDALCQLLAERAPQALYDTRLVTTPRKGTLDALGRESGSTTATTSNQGETDLAAHLLAVARYRGQL